MFSRKSRIIAGISSVLAGAGAVATIAATSASAAPVKPAIFPTPHACAYNLNGGNELSLTFQGSTFTYPIVLHVSPDGLVTGFLLDKGLPVGHQILRVDGACFRSNLTIDTEYGLTSVQGLRDETMRITQLPLHPHYGKAAGVWDETGTEAGSGVASLLLPVHRY